MKVYQFYLKVLSLSLFSCFVFSCGGDDDEDTNSIPQNSKAIDFGSAPSEVVAVDLGLPSGTKWANVNIGAKTPEESGLFFAWGEVTGCPATNPKGRRFDFSSYKWGEYNAMTKYTRDHDMNISGDGYNNLELSDDAACAYWGGNWRMPHDIQFYELISNCSLEWTMMNGVLGYLLTSKANGNNIFLPAGGSFSTTSTEIKLQGSVGTYWLADLSSGGQNSGLSFNVTSYMPTTTYGAFRCEGKMVRPVIK